MKVFFQAVLACSIISSTPSFAFFKMPSFSLFKSQEVEEVKEVEKAPTIRILLKKQADGSLLEVKGSYEVLNIKTRKKVSSGSKGKRFYLYPHKEGIKWGEDFLGIYQIRIIPTSPESSILVDGIQYKGTVDIFHVNEKVNVINEVDIEHYLKSTLASQFAQHIHPVVMDALTISARTNAYYHVMHNQQAYWHVDAQDVNYLGLGATMFNPNIDRSIDTTQFLIMTYENQPFATTWSKNCAGKTASYQSIFRKNVLSPAGVKSPFAETARKENHWSFVIDKSTLAKIAKTNRVTGLDLYVDSSSEKVYAIRVQDGSHFKEVDFFHLQKGLGTQNVPSNDFTITLQGDNVVFDGYGEGCSVGLCIYSAVQMAKRGDSAPEILATFYPYSRIEQQKALPEKTLINASKKTPHAKHKNKLPAKPKFKS